MSDTNRSDRGHVTSIEVIFQPDTERITIRLECAHGCGRFELVDWPLVHVWGIVHVIEQVAADHDIAIEVATRSMAVWTDAMTPVEQAEYATMMSEGQQLFQRARAAYRCKLN